MGGYLFLVVRLVAKFRFILSNTKSNFRWNHYNIIYMYISYTAYGMCFNVH